MPDILLTTSC